MGARKENYFAKTVATPGVQILPKRIIKQNIQHIKQKKTKSKILASKTTIL